MSNKTTPAVERTMQQINAMLGGDEPKFVPEHARSVLNAALSNLEEMALWLYTFHYEMEPEDGVLRWFSIPEETRVHWRAVADGLRATLLGTTS